MRKPSEITDRAKRYRAQNNVTGPKKCVLCGKGGRLDVMHLTGNEAHGEKENLAYGCRSCNASLGAAFKSLKLGKPTNQYNPSKGVPTLQQYMWAVSNHSRGAHDAGGAIIHATPKHKRVEYAKAILRKALATKRERFEDRWNPPTPGERFDDLQKQGFMKPRKAKRVPIYEAWTPHGVTYTGPDKSTAEWHVRQYGEGQGKVKRKNPAKFDRCVKAVKKKGGANAYAVCTAAGTRNPSIFDNEDAFRQGRERAAGLGSGARSVSGSTITKEFNRWWKAAGIPGNRTEQLQAYKRGWKSRLNPAGASAEVFEEFHGFKPSEVVTVSKEIHHHEHLAALGTLTMLDVWGVDGQGHKITGFKKALLCCNEDRNQLFIEGGDQTIDLKDYGIRQTHELETLGTVTNIGYKTNKTHLGDEGGEAVYVHRFRATNDNGKHVIVKMTREPNLIYDVRNEQLLFSGGSYEILPEGINK